MKCLVLMVAIVFSVGSAEDQAHQEDDFASIRKEAVAKCSKEHNINEGAIKDILNHIQVAQDEEVKCWTNCVMKSLGILKERTIDWARLEDILNSASKNENKTQVHLLVEMCRSKVDQADKNECQVAYSLVVCKIKYWNQLGLPKGNWE
ncbi:unnamed protein product [Nezara viridula]|uniref:Uncharacterized protein n=1 Tax=Nezara viridula TaxID=85310 RepID=A0A9P0H029_NEZVI|nr:unnamed protein product [Nezara viridula]